MRKGPMLYLDVSGSTLEPLVVQTAEQIFSAKDAEIARLRAKIAAVQDVVNSTTIRTRIDEAWVEKLCRALDAMPATDMQDKANFAETQQIRYVRK